MPITEHHKVPAWVACIGVAFSCYMVMFNVLDSAFLGLMEPRSPFYTASAITGWRIELSLAFIAAAAMVAPFAVQQAFLRIPPNWMLCLACAGLALAALLWAGVVFSIRRTDLTAVTVMYVRQAGEVMFALVFIASLHNARQRSDAGLDEHRHAMFHESNRVPLQ